MTLALIWSLFWSGEPRHRQSLLGSKCPFCTSLVPSAGSAAPSSWFTHSWVQTNSHIHRRSHTYTHTDGKWARFKCCQTLMTEIITNMCIWVLATQLLCTLFLDSLLVSMSTGTHPATHSHLDRSLVSGTTGRAAGSACRVTNRNTKAYDSSLNKCMHIQSHAISQMHGTHRKHALTHARTLRYHKQ